MPSSVDDLRTNITAATPFDSLLASAVLVYASQLGFAVANDDSAIRFMSYVLRLASILGAFGDGFGMIGFILGHVVWRKFPVM